MSHKIIARTLATAFALAALAPAVASTSDHAAARQSLTASQAVGAPLSSIAKKCNPNQDPLNCATKFY